MIAVIGAGGHTRSSINLIKDFFKDDIIRIYDNNYIFNEMINGIPVVGIENKITSEEKIFLSIGNNIYREELFNKYFSQLIKQNLIHKTSFYESNMTIGIANQIYAKVYINCNTNIGNDNIINSGAIIEHESIIGNHNHISVGSKICGRVTIEDNCFIGAGAIVINNISICSNVIIGAGSVVVKDIIKPGTYVGNPVRKIK